MERKKGGRERERVWGEKIINTVNYVYKYICIYSVCKSLRCPEDDKSI